MKKLLFTLLTVISLKAMAQDGPPQGPPPMDSAKMHTMMVKRYQDAKLGLTEAQIEDVVNVNKSMMSEMRSQKKKEMSEMEKTKLSKLTEVLGDEKLAKKVMDYDKKNRPQGPGGHGGPPPSDN